MRVGILLDVWLGLISIFGQKLGLRGQIYLLHPKTGRKTPWFGGIFDGTPLLWCITMYYSRHFGLVITCGSVYNTFLGDGGLCSSVGFHQVPIVHCEPSCRGFFSMPANSGLPALLPNRPFHSLLLLLLFYEAIVKSKSPFLLHSIAVF